MKVHVSKVAAMMLLLFGVSPGIGCSNGRGRVVECPVGTIVPYAGTIATIKDVPKGWLWCDGKKVPAGAAYKPLRDLLGQAAWGNEGAEVRVPDLRGMFLRGAGQNDDKKFQYKDDDRHRVGHYQSDATALPKKAFKLTPGEHLHTLKGAPSGANKGTHVGPGDPYGGEFDINATRTAGLAHCGQHNHTFTDGDDETRPQNVGVHFIIKY